MKAVLVVFAAAALTLAIPAHVSTQAQPASSPAPTFNKDVAPIVFGSCVT